MGSTRTETGPRLRHRLALHRPVAFLDRTDRIVPIGQEAAFEDIDAELTKILTSQAP